MKALVKTARPLAVACIPLMLGWQAAVAAPVPLCEALTMYGWGADSGTCIYLSMPSPYNHWVCGLTANGANPDVHTTVNATTNLHMTVINTAANPHCTARNDLSGHYPGQLAFAAPGPVGNTMCGVNVAPHLAALNGIAGNGCKAGFVEAQNNERLDPATVTAYVKLCKMYNCP